MKLKNFPVFIVCLSVLTSGLMRQPVQPAQPTLTNIIYADALVAGWDNWSWGDTLNFAATAPVHSGSDSIAITLSGWGALSLHNPGIDTLGTTILQFFMNGGSAGGQKIDIWLDLDVNGQDVQGPTFTVPPPAANAWEAVDAPLSTLNPTGATITRLNWQSTVGSAQPVFYFDDVSFTSPVDPNAPTLANGSLTPRSIPADGQATLVVKVKVADPQGAADIASVTLDASTLGRGLVTLADDGRSNDGQANDGIYGVALTVAPSIAPGEAKLGVTATDKEGHANFLPLGALTVLGSPGGAIPAVLPQHFGWGSDAWNGAPGQDWQVNSGVPWNYVYQYITQGWETWGTNFVSGFVNHAWINHYVPIVTVYMILGIVAGGNENSAYYAAQLQNASKVQAYLASLQRAAQQSVGTKPVIFNIEPDFYGYMQQLSNSSNRPAGVVANNPASYPVALNISGYPNTLAGFGQYLVTMIHTSAPNALVAPMASMWATNMDPQSVTPDQAIQMGQSTANFINAMGGDKADALIVEWSDRDAGDPTPPVRPWWDDQDMKLPRPTRATLWENALSRQAGKRLILWQIPVGNMTLDNSCHHYQDNRAAYAFSHTRDLFDAGVIGLVFGGGAGCETSVETDGGFVAAQGAIAYAAPAMPTGLSAGGVLLGGVVALRWNENTEPDLWGYQVVYQPAAGGQASVVDVHRKNALSLLLPFAGDWKIGVMAYDAMGNLSPETAQVTVTSLDNAKQLFLPLALH